MASISSILMHAPTRYSVQINTASPAFLKPEDVPALLAAARVASEPDASAVLCPQCANNLPQGMFTLKKLTACYKPCASCGNRTFPPRPSRGTARLQVSADNL